MNIHPSKTHRIRSCRLFFLCLSVVYLQSCITTPFLKKGELLLINQRVKGNKVVHNEDLEILFKQKANRKLLGITPYLGFYFFGKSILDTNRVRRQLVKKQAYYDKKIALLPPGSFKDSIFLEGKKEKKSKKYFVTLYEGNWWMRVVGEPPAIYDSSQAKGTMSEIKKTLFNRGFFDATVQLKEDTFIGGNVSVKYIIKENSPHLIRSVKINTDDFRLERLVDSARSDLQVKVGKPYSKSDISEDRDYIERLFRNKGYFSFSRDYIMVAVDTLPTAPVTKSDSLLFKANPALFSRLGADVTMTIRNPEGGRHKPYVIDKIFFQLNESDSSTGKYKDTLFNGVKYSFETRKRYSLGILDSKILVHPGQYFNYSRVTNTQAQLSSMDMFRFVNLALDTHGSKMSMRITANRLQKYQSSEELGLLMSQGAPGPYVDVGLKVRNILGGFEGFAVNVRYSQEGQLSSFLPQDVVFRARDLSITSSFTISKILFPFKLNPRIFEYNPKTRFIFSFSALKRPEYTRNLAKGTLNYSMQLSPSQQIGISPIDVTVNIAPYITDGYITQLIENSGLGQGIRQSFSTYLVTNFNAYYMYNTSTGGKNKKAKYLRINVEYGGELIHQVLKNILRRDTTTIGQFQTFRYAKASADFRIFRPLSKKTMLAFRVSGGVAVPVGKSQVLPWEKYNFAGGSNSVRAWLPRRLGPGSYAPAGSDPNNLKTEQPGELILESSVEIRQKLIGFLEGAVFLDAGNVWNLKKDQERDGAEISPYFLRQIAFGGGFGLRFDFSFLIIRIDAATKLYNPAFPSNGDKWQFKNRSFLKPFGSKGQTLLNVGIGYPF